MKREDDDVITKVKKDIEKCWGCNLYDKKRNMCYEYGNPIPDCICQSCVVKVICRVHCEDALLQIKFDTGRDAWAT